MEFVISYDMRAPDFGAAVGAPKGTQGITNGWDTLGLLDGEVDGLVLGDRDGEMLGDVDGLTLGGVITQGGTVRACGPKKIRSLSVNAMR